jgi:hypothetical protein
VPTAARRFVPLEIAAVAALAGLYAWRDIALPIAAPLFGIASLSRWARGRSWDDTMRGSRSAGPAALCGLVALALALAAGTPLVELSGRAVEWSQYPIVRGSASQLFAVALLVAITAVAAELALRGWIVERALELGAGPLAAIAIGAVAEGLVWPGHLAARAGAAVFGAGLGALYVAAGRTAGAPIAARVTFVIGALVLEGLRLVG